MSHTKFELMIMSKLRKAIKGDVEVFIEMGTMETVVFSDYFVSRIYIYDVDEKIADGWSVSFFCDVILDQYKARVLRTFFLDNAL